jgi:hypothetical protein
MVAGTLGSVERALSPKATLFALTANTRGRRRARHGAKVALEESVFERAVEPYRLTSVFECVAERTLVAGVLVERAAGRKVEALAGRWPTLGAFWTRCGQAFAALKVAAVR